MPDGLGLIYSASPQGVDLGLWWRLLQGGEAQPLTIGTGDFAEPRISADGRMLVATRIELRQSLTRVGLMATEYGRMTAITNGFNGGSGSKRIALGRPAGVQLVAYWRPAYLDGQDRWLRHPAADLGQCPGRPPDVLARWPIGRVRLGSRRPPRHLGHQRRRRIAAKLADVSTTGSLSWSRDGKRVVYAAGTGSWPGLWSVSVEDGQVQRIPTSGAVSVEPVWNPARDLIAYMEPAMSGPSFTGLAFVDSADSANMQRSLAHRTSAADSPTEWPRGLTTGAASPWSVRTLIAQRQSGSSIRR